jgi:hypothetical protein
VRARPDQAELPLQESRPAAGIDDPPRGDLMRALRAGERHPVHRRLVEHDRLHAVPVQHRGAHLGVGAKDEVFEPPAIELERRHRRKPRRAELDTRSQIAVVAVREEVAQAELLELLRGEVRLEPEPLLKIVRADLDARFADLERGLGDRMLPLLDDQDAEVGRFLPQLPRQASPARPPPRMTTS